MSTVVAEIDESAKSVSASELTAIQNFVQMMTEEVIPSIVDIVEERRTLAAGSRQHLLRI